MWTKVYPHSEGRRDDEVVEKKKSWPVVLMGETEARLGRAEDNLYKVVGRNEKKSTTRTRNIIRVVGEGGREWWICNASRK